LKPKERQHTVERYAERLQLHGAVVQVLGWRDQAQQELRFRVMADGLREIANASILDIGCGFGDLYHYLTGRAAGLRYVGCDISPDLLQVARERHPQVQFDLRDVLDAPYPENSFDYVFISGIFNYRIEDNEGFLEQTLATAYRMCVRGVAANMMTDQVDYRDKHLHYFNPERVLRFCRKLSRRVALRHDYPLYEFTVFVYRDSDSPQLWQSQEGK
jgi:ubiquinone/menaquinone biosynthesis C-methylase UbiE